jgi:hypothetical protein
LAARRTLKRAEQRAKAAEEQAKHQDERREIDRLTRECEADKAYLQAQLDSANAMWAYYRRGGSPEQQGSQFGTEAASGKVATEDRQKATAGTEKTAHSRGLDVRTGERNARELALHAGRLEHKYAQILASLSWRATGPARSFLRVVERLMLNRRAHPNRWPKRPQVMHHLLPAPNANGKTKTAPRAGRSLSAAATGTPASAGDLHELQKYADQLETRIGQVLASKSWKITAPARVLVRAFTRIVLRKRATRNRLPKRSANR